MKNRNKSGFGAFVAFILLVIIATLITLIVISSMNSRTLKETLIDISGKIQVGVSNIQNYINGKNENLSVVPDNIEFPEEEDLTGAQRYYYYQQLSYTAKKMYVAIENNVDKMKNGEDNIPLPPSLNEDAKSNPDGKQYIAKEFQNAWDAFVTDKSEYFYIDSSKVCLVTKITTTGSTTDYEFFIGKGNNENYLIDEFKNKEEVDYAIKEIEQIKTEISKNATGNNYEKIKYVHDWLINNVKYDTSKGENTANIYGCLVKKSAICEGYSRGFKYLLDELEIPCVLVSGTAVDEDGKSERHAWNYVYIKNNWYAIDITWDDPIIIGNGKVDESVKYKYFLKGGKTIKKDHFETNQITKGGYSFKYPELSEEDIK